MNQLQPIASVLNEKEFSKLDAIKEELNDSWHKRQIFRTDTEARYAVLNDFKFPTNAGKYWQAVREQCVHFDELTTLSFELRRKKLDLQEIDDKLAEKSVVLTDLARNRLLVDRDECLFHIASGEQVAKDRVREIMQWSKIKEEVNDGSFDDKDVNTHQKESLFRQVLNRAQVAPKDISAEERLSIDGILNSLQHETVNKDFLEKINKKKAAIEKK